jgi:hypothetical protein
MCFPSFVQTLASHVILRRGRPVRVLDVHKYKKSSERLRLRLFRTRSRAMTFEKRHLKVTIDAGA